MNRCNNCNEQQHVHEIIGITETIVNGCEGHNHRIATVSGEAIETCNNHVHEVIFRTDFADGHYHEFCGTSEPAVYVGEGKHVHYVNAETDCADGHTHYFQLASLIDEPTTSEDDSNDCDCDCCCGCNCGCGCN
ncbi:MAG TPA: YmaF family protein, partial [Candidatus Avidehalobacter gallistercoris]|nr:YmaF family protein [Candidatus Avidehalobacter gallistercoris]